MKKLSKRIPIIILATALLLVFSSACSTVRGFGRDVERVGGNIEKSAR